MFLLPFPGIYFSGKFSALIFASECGKAWPLSKSPSLNSEMSSGNYQKYFRKSPFEKYKRIRPLRNHLTIQWLSAIDRKETQDTLNPLVIPKPLSGIVKFIHI